MAINYLHVVHAIGAFLLFAGFGGLLAGTDNKNTNRLVAALHGSGLLLLLLSGFAVQGIASHGFPLWIILKIVLWLALAVLFVLTKKGRVSTVAGIAGSLIVGAVAVWLCVMKPFT